MSSISEHHVGKCGVTGKCSVPMWSGYGGPAGFCDEEAFGEQYAEGTRHAPPWWSPRDRNGYLLRPDHRAPFAPALCCKRHGGPGPNDIRFIRDGNVWCAFMADFINLAESVAGFGETQPAAEADLRAAISRATPDTLMGEDKS